LPVPAPSPAIASPFTKAIVAALTPSSTSSAASAPSGPSAEPSSHGSRGQPGAALLIFQGDGE
jgi:hypothetical protein